MSLHSRAALSLVANSVILYSEAGQKAGRIQGRPVVLCGGCVQKYADSWASKREAAAEKEKCANLIW